MTEILGGGMAKAGDVLFTPLRHYLDIQMDAAYTENLLIIPARFGNDAGMLGAALVAQPGVELPFAHLHVDEGDGPPQRRHGVQRHHRTLQPLDHGSYFDLTAHDLGSELRKQTVLRLESMGIPVEYSFHENGPSQHEIDLRYTDALAMADNVMTFRLIAKEVAHDHGVDERLALRADLVRKREPEELARDAMNAHMRPACAFAVPGI